MPQTRRATESSSLSEGESSDAMTASQGATKPNKKRKGANTDRKAKCRRDNNDKVAERVDLAVDPDIDNLDDDIQTGAEQQAAGSSSAMVSKQTRRKHDDLSDNRQAHTAVTGEINSVLLSQESAPGRSTIEQESAMLDPKQLELIFSKGMPALIKAVREDPEARRMLAEGLAGGTAVPTSSVTVTNTACVLQNRKQGNVAQVTVANEALDQTQSVNSDSDVTLFEPCLQQENPTNQPLNSDDSMNALNSSDETDRQLIMDRFVQANQSGGEILSDVHQRSVVDAGREQERSNKQGQPSRATADHQSKAKDRARDAVRDAENAQVRLLHPPGENVNITQEQVEAQLNQLRFQATMGATATELPMPCKPRRSVTFASQAPAAGSYVAQHFSDDDSDDDYHIYAHVDDKTIAAIKKGEFVELGKVAPDGSLDIDDEGRLNMVTKGGRVCVESADKAPSNITNYQQWQSAFRVFSAIYQRAFPDKSLELLEYEHNIQNAARHFIWRNVATYDRMFRKRVARRYLKGKRISWAEKYARAWDFELQEKLTKPYNLFNPKGSTGTSPTPGTSGTAQQGRKEICIYFNKTGKCRYGNKCHREHRCMNCGARGHAMINCFKLKKGEDSNNNSKKQ